MRSTAAPPFKFFESLRFKCITHKGTRWARTQMNHKNTFVIERSEMPLAFKGFQVYTFVSERSEALVGHKHPNSKKYFSDRRHRGVFGF